MKFSRRDFLAVTAGTAIGGIATEALAQAQSVDLILFNGKIVTVDSAFSIRQAIAVKDGRVVAVGGNELRNRYSAAKTIDLRGRTVIPGLHDTHIHLGGHSRRYIDLNETTSLAQLKQQVRDKAKELGPKEWITGAGWDEYHFTDEQRKPVRKDLDAVAPDNPVVLTRAGGHSSVGNSKALELADINKATPNPERGIIEKDPNGEPNGVIRERNDLYTRLVPRDKPADVRDSFFEDVHRQLRLGITSVIQAGASVDPNVAGSYAEWEVLYAKHGEDLPRASVQIQFPDRDAKIGEAKLKEFRRKTGDGNERLRIGSIGEMAADGGFTGPTAWSLVDYKGQPGFRGRGFFTPEQIHANIEAGHKLGWQYGIHAIGDAAIAMTVDAYDKVLQDYPRNDHRHYLCHFTVLPPERTMQIMAKDKILIAQQPNFTYNLEGRYVDALEGKRLMTNNALQTPIKHGIFMAFGSDNLPIGPMVGLYAAVTRKGESGKVYGAEEAVSMKDALTMYTRNGALITREENVKGSLEPGKVADMVVLPEDLLTVSPEKVLNMKVDMTIVGGKVLYERSGA
ncbi:MAG TPA: amidohydrolase [Bryobacteraceae bacterium]|nr:amidohydrolase [Bryobacteraceae bacterium]